MKRSINTELEAYNAFKKDYKKSENKKETVSVEEHLRDFFTTLGGVEITEEGRW